MRIAMVDPPAYTPPYDHALSAALADLGHQVELFTSRFAYAPVTSRGAHRTHELFYRHAVGPASSRTRRLSKLAEHPLDMLRLRRAVSDADVVHLQWLTVPVLDRWLLPHRPTVLTAHDLLPREPRPGQLAAQRALLRSVDAVITHSEHGRRRLLEAVALDPARVHVVPHGVFDHLTAVPAAPLPGELCAAEGEPVVLFFGLLRPYKGVEVLLEAWREVRGGQLWIAGHPRMPLAPLRAAASSRVSFLPRYVEDAELVALFRRADIVVLPYTRTERFDQSGVLATALAFGKATVVSDIGGFGEVARLGAAELVAPDDPEALATALRTLIDSPAQRAALAQAARQAAEGPLSWREAARRTVQVYRGVIGG